RADSAPASVQRLFAAGRRTGPSTTPPPVGPVGVTVTVTSRNSCSRRLAGRDHSQPAASLCDRATEYAVIRTCPPPSSLVPAGADAFHVWPTSSRISPATASAK